MVFQVIVTGLLGHCDLSEINPDPDWLASQNCGGIHLVDRLNPQLIGSYMVMTTLHTPSICSPSPGTTSTTSDSLVITNCSYIPAPAILLLPFAFLLLSLTFKQTGSYLGASVLGCQASACHDHRWPYSSHIKWDHITIKLGYFVCNMDE